MKKLGIILVLGSILFLCVGLKFDSVAMNSSSSSSSNQELPSDMQKILLSTTPIRESIPASGDCLSNRFKRLINLLQDGNKNIITTLPAQNTSIATIGWNLNGSDLITLALNHQTTIAKIWNSHGVQLGPDLPIVFTNNAQFFSKNTSIQSSIFDFNPYAWVWSWSPDGSDLAFVSNKTAVKIWNKLQNGERRTLPHDSNVTSMAWNPDGTELAIGYENGAKIWNIDKKTNITLNNDTPLIISSVAWSPDGSRLATGSYSECDCSSDSESNCSESDCDEDASTESCCPETGEIKIWNTTTGIEVKKLVLNEGIHSIAWSPNGQKIAGVNIGDNNSAVLIWKFTEEVLHLAHPNQWINQVAWSPDGNKLVTLGIKPGNFDTSEAKIWNTSTGTQIGATLNVDRALQQLAWSPDGSKILSTRGNIKMWDAATGVELWQDLLTRDHWNLASWSPDGAKLATSSIADGVNIWDVATKTPILSNPNLRGNSLMAWNPNSRKLVLVNHNYAPTIWDLDSFLQVKDFSDHLNIDQCDLLQAFDMAISDTGRIQATIGQWQTFTTFPQSMQNRLNIFIRPPRQISMEERAANIKKLKKAN